MASTSSKSKSIPHQKLSLTTTSLHNVVISNTSDVIYYEIITPKWEKDLTKISRLDPNTKQYDLICELVNEHDKPVSMRLYGGATNALVKKASDCPRRLTRSLKGSHADVLSRE